MTQVQTQVPEERSTPGANTDDVSVAASARLSPDFWIVWIGDPVLVRALPFALFMLALALRGLATQCEPVAWLLDTRWLYGAQVAFALVPLLLWRRTYGELRAAPRSGAALAASVFAGLAVFVLWIAPMPAWAHLSVGSGLPFASLPATFVPVDANGALRWDLIAMRTSGAVLLVPLMEELFWRSFLMRWIDKPRFLSLPPASVSWLGVLASSAVFATVHDLWLAALIAGVVYSQLYRRLGNLWYAVLAHATTNFALAAWIVDFRAWGYW